MITLATSASNIVLIFIEIISSVRLDCLRVSFTAIQVTLDRRITRSTCHTLRSYLGGITTFRLILFGLYIVFVSHGLGRGVNYLLSLGLLGRGATSSLGKSSGHIKSAAVLIIILIRVIGSALLMVVIAFRM